MQKGFEPNKYYTVHSTVRHLHAQSRRAVSLVGVLCGGLYKPCPCIPVHTVMTFLYLSPCKALLRGPPSLTHTQTRLVLELITDCSWLTKRNGGHYSRWLSHSTSFFPPWLYASGIRVVTLVRTLGFQAILSTGCAHRSQHCDSKRV